VRCTAFALIATLAAAAAASATASVVHAPSQTQVHAGSDDLIAYSFRDWRKNGGDDWEVFLTDPTNDSERDLSRDPSCDDAYATWSPDRTTLAYMCSSLIAGHVNLLMTIGVDGSGRRVWLRTKQGIGSPRFSPDGSQLAAMVGNTLELVTVAGGSVRPITRAGGGQVAWSSDGSELALTRSGQKGVWIVNRDGSKLLYTTSTGTLALIGADGSGRRQLGVPAEQASWSPDGTQIAYSSDQIGLWRINIDGTHRHQFSLVDQIVSVAWAR
jgi:Tol biopolymer transport system component